MSLKLAAIAAMAILAGCSTPTDPSLPRGLDSYGVVPAVDTNSQRAEYEIGPLDTLSITVFQEPSLTFASIPVDASGDVTMPLIGNVRASGKTANELSRDIATRLNTRYLRNSQVSVVVVSSVSQRVTVEGNVTQPGIYEISGGSSLLASLALARSPTPVAKLNEVVVFRNINGRRAGAVFDVNKIRAGTMPDPEIKGGDVVVVGYSGLKGGFRNFLATAPILNLFRYF